MPHGLQIRAATPTDIDIVLSLWREAQPVRTPGESPEALSRLLGRDPGALLVAELEARVVGVLIAAFDGWRGTFYRLAVHPDARRAGIGTALVRVGEERLRALGASRISAIVVSDEPGASAFWRAAGFVAQEGRTRYVNR